MKQYSIYYRKDGHWEGRIPVLDKAEESSVYTGAWEPPCRT